MTSLKVKCGQKHQLFSDWTCTGEWRGQSPGQEDNQDRTQLLSPWMIWCQDLRICFQDIWIFFVCCRWRYQGYWITNVPNLEKLPPWIQTTTGRRFATTRSRVNTFNLSKYIFNKVIANWLKTKTYQRKCKAVRLKIRFKGWTDILPKAILISNPDIWLWSEVLGTENKSFSNCEVLLWSTITRRRLPEDKHGHLFLPPWSHPTLGRTLEFANAVPRPEVVHEVWNMKFEF